MQDMDIIPDKKKRSPNFYVIIYKTDEGLAVQEEATRGDALKFVRRLGDPDLVVKLYKASAAVPLREKTVIVF